MSLTDVATVLTLFFAAVGLFFAAVAAWGAVETVRLTRLTRDEADVRRLRDALLGLKHACNLIERTPEYGWNPDLEDRFLDARSELERAYALPPEGANPDADEMIGQLLTAEPRRATAHETWLAADRAAELVDVRRPIQHSRLSRWLGACLHGAPWHR